MIYLPSTSVAVPTRLRVEQWAFSFRELLEDPVGRAHFMDFLGKEFSGEKPPPCCLPDPTPLPRPAPRCPAACGGSDLVPGPPAENLSFWEACEELRHGGQARVPALVDAVYQ